MFDPHRRDARFGPWPAMSVMSRAASPVGMATQSHQSPASTPSAARTSPCTRTPGTAGSVGIDNSGGWQPPRGALCSSASRADRASSISDTSWRRIVSASLPSAAISVGAERLDRGVVFAATGDGPQLSAQIVDRPEDPAHQQEPGREQRQQQDDESGDDDVAQLVGRGR